MLGGRFACHSMVVLAVLSPGSARAQSAAEGPIDLTAGARIRVTVVDPPPSGVSERRIVGVFAAWDRGALSLAASPSETLALPQDAILTLERSVRPSRKPRGALIGFAVGLAAAIGKAALQGGCNDGCNEANVAAAVLLGLSTAVVGAVAAPGEVWAEVPLERGPGQTAMPGEAGWQVRLVPLVGPQTGLAVVASF